MPAKMDDPRCFPLSIEATGGEPALRGEVIVANEWSAELDGVTEGGDFRIVALTANTGFTLPDVSNPAVAVLVPEGRRAAEPVAPYLPGGAGAPPVLGAALTAALRRGQAIAAEPIAIADALGADGPRWTALGRRLAGAARRHSARRAATLALDCDRESLDARARELLDATADAEGVFGQSRTHVSMLIEGDLLPVSPVQVADDVFALRAHLANPDAAKGLLAMRRFLADAVVPEHDRHYADLALDRAVTREQLSFGALLADPSRFAVIEAAFESFVRRYETWYAREHRERASAIRDLRTQVDLVEDDARALRLLNSVGGLGRPLGTRALRDFDRLRSGIVVCADPRLDGARARCATCGFALGEPLPSDAADISARVRRGLLGQQRRLARETVRRLLERDGDDGIERFLHVVQASDLEGLTRALDDRVVAFLRELLSDAAPRVELAPVLASLAERFGEVGEDDIERVVEALRSSIHEALRGDDRSAGRDRIALASP